MAEAEEQRPFAAQLSNVYLTIFALFCFKLFVKISLAILSHYYIVKGNRKEAARIAAEFYGVTEGHRNDMGEGANVWNAAGVILDINSGSWADRSPLHEAASQGRLLSLKTLLSQGYSVNILTIDHVTPLHEACLGGHVACARALLEAGANVNAGTIDGITPLFNACSQGSAACVELLLDYGASVLCDMCQPSPLHEATRKGKTDCVDALLSWGADADLEIPHLGTPLYLACVFQHLHCASKLLDGGADIQKGRFLDTPLHAAAQHSSLEMAQLLLDFGADVNARNVDLKRAAEVAAPSSVMEGFLLMHEVTPSSLLQMCRLKIRQSLGRARLHLIPQLQLPTSLQNFLQHR